jgi:MFS family permease
MQICMSAAGEFSSASVSSLISGDYFKIPLDHHRGWLTVASGFVNFFVLFGLVASFPVFLQPLSADPAFAGVSTALLNLAGSLQISLARVLGLVGGYLISRFGCRPIVAVSAVAQFFAYFATSYVSDVSGLICVFTSLMLFAMGFSLVPVLTSVGSFFSAKRNLAQGLLSAGSGLGGAVFPLIISELLERYDNDWRPVFRICGAFSVMTLGMSVFSPIRDDGVVATPYTSPRQFSRRKLVTNRAFVTLCVYCFLLGFTFYGQGFMVVPFALQFVSRSRAVLILSFAGVASVAGNIISGILTDKVTTRRAQIAQYALNSLLCIVWAFAVHSYNATMAIAVASWFARPIGTATLIGELFKGHHLGEVLAATYLFIGAGGTAGPPALAALTAARGGDFTASWIVCGAASMAASLLVVTLPTDPQDIYEERHVTSPDVYNQDSVNTAGSNGERSTGSGEEVPRVGVLLQEPRLRQPGGGGAPGATMMAVEMSSPGAVALHRYTWRSFDSAEPSST